MQTAIEKVSCPTRDQLLRVQREGLHNDRLCGHERFATLGRVLHFPEDSRYAAIVRVPSRRTGIAAQVHIVDTISATLPVSYGEVMMRIKPGDLDGVRSLRAMKAAAIGIVDNLNAQA